ncbi:MAG TPA: serine/threonine protein kinase [Kiritimatiellae bacterium]|nr:serine/threonine protein kinase [Kiritimatiellia bacterium]
MGELPSIPHYDVVRELHRGGMTILYLVRDDQGYPAVLRILRPEFARDSRIRRRFTRAAQIMEELVPHVPQLIECGRHKGLYYMVLHYIPGGNLRELILHRDRRLIASPLPLLIRIAEAIAAIHARGYLHMDIKPENVLVVKDSLDIFIIDCDLAVQYSGAPVKLGVKPGTPAYVAPEALSVGVVDERSDIFSFGVTAYEALTFHKPFEAESVEEMRRRQVSPDQPPTPIGRYRQDVSRDLERIILKCLAKAPDQRYPSMALVVRDMRSLIRQ